MGSSTMSLEHILYNTWCLCVWATWWSTNLDVHAISWFFDEVPSCCTFVWYFYVLSWSIFHNRDVWKGEIQAMGSWYCLVSILGATSNMGDWVTPWEDDCNQSSGEKNMVVPLWNCLKKLKYSKFGNSIQLQRIIQWAKNGWKFRKGFQKMEVKIICENLFLWN